MSRSARLRMALAVGWCAGVAACASTRPRGPADLPTPPREGIPLAVTVDDLPFVGPTPRGEPAVAALGRVAQVLRQHGVPAMGFVTCDRLAAQPGALAPWRAAGLAIGNHSTAHRALDDMTLAAWTADVAGCRDRLAALTGMRPRYFRYPFLRTGADRARRDAGLAALTALGHVRAPVSIDTSEWALAAPYAAAVRAGNSARATAIATAYVEHLRLAARHYRRVAHARMGREVAQVLLLHANALAADHMGRVLTMLRAEGFRFVPLEAALQDPVYAQEDAWVDPVGASWLYRTAPPDPAAWAWDRAQQRALEARFGSRDDGAGPFRIGRDLRVRHLPGTPAWLVNHAAPIPANSLVFVTADGTPVLADTPWTPTATQDLLDWVTVRFGRPPALATISHFHLDAAGGIGTLRAAGVPVVASTETARLLAARGDRMRAELAREHGRAFAGWVVAAPDVLFAPADGYAARIGGTEVRVVFPGHAHAPDNVVTWFPASGVLFGGCLVKGGPDLGYLGDANVPTYPAAVDRLLALRPRVVVPGHGARTDPEQLAHTRALAVTWLQKHGK